MRVRFREAQHAPIGAEVVAELLLVRSDRRPLSTADELNHVALLGHAFLREKWIRPRRGGAHTNIAVGHVRSIEHHVRPVHRVHLLVAPFISSPSPLRGAAHRAERRAGLHVTTFLTDRSDDRAAVRRLRAHGLTAAPLSLCYAGRARRAGLLLGFGGFDERTLSAATRVLGEALRDHRVD